MSRSPRVWLWLAPWLALNPAAPGGEATASKDAPPYPHKSFTAKAFGTGARSYWLYEPDEPRPAKAPVVVFNHGWLAVNPGVYGAWIEHLTRSGRVVIFPKYQADWSTRPIEFLPNAVAAIRAAFDVLDAGPGRVRPDRDRVALVGHSAGGNLSAQLAAVAEEMGLPRFKAVVAIFPGEVVHFREPSLARIPPETLLVVAVAEQDLLVGDYRAREIYAEATAIPPSRKEYVLYRSDRHTEIPLLAEHFAPTALLPGLDTGEGPFRLLQLGRAGVDILDRYGFWRLADLTLEAAFAGRTLDEATDLGAKFRDLGRWGDGVPVAPPISGDDLQAIPRVVAPIGVRFLSRNPNEFRQVLEDERPQPDGRGGTAVRGGDGVLK